MQWFDIRDPNDPLLDELAARYHLHPLHIEDCRHRHQSAKIEENGGYIFVVLKPLDVDDRGCLQPGDLDIFLGPDYVITVEESECAGVRKILDGLHALKDRLQPDQLFYRIADALVDSYLPVIDRTDDIIDALQDEVLANPTPDALSRIFESKRNLILLRRVLANTRDVAGHLQRTEHQLIRRELWPFLRDVYDHVARNLDLVEMQRDMLTGALDVYLSSVANRTNEVVKFLTLLGTLTFPPIVISGIYGMNVEGLPFAHSPWLVLGIIAASTAGLYGALRYFKWL